MSRGGNGGGGVRPPHTHTVLPASVAWVRAHLRATHGEEPFFLSALLDEECWRLHKQTHLDQDVFHERIRVL